MPPELHLQLFRRLARAFKRSSVQSFDEHEVSKSASSRISRIEKTLHKRSATCTDTPDWLCTPITAQSSVPLRMPTLACPSSSSVASVGMKSPTSAIWKKGTFGRTADAARRRLSKSPSQPHLQRNDSVLSFASADAFGKMDFFDDDGTDMFTSAPSSASCASPRTPYHHHYSDSNARTVRRTRSNTDTSNYSLPSSFNYQTSPTSSSSSSSHRPKNSESSIYTEDTAESEVLMTCQMEESAYQAIRSRPSSLIKIRRSFSDERNAYGRERVWR